MSTNTSEARAVLPSQVSREDAVFNLGRTALFVNALATGRLELLRHATEDRLHQPQRGKFFPAMKNIIRAALDGGAHGAFLSGAGPTVMALTTGREVTVSVRDERGGPQVERAWPRRGAASHNHRSPSSNAMSPNPVIVQKFGGSSLAEPDLIRNVATRICKQRSEGVDLVAVVSAMGDTTDDLIKWHTMSPAQAVRHRHASWTP